MLCFELLPLRPVKVWVCQCVEDRVFAFFQECAGALVAFLIGIAMLLGLYLWAGGHIVIVVEIGHIPDASESRSVMPSQKRGKPLLLNESGSWGQQVLRIDRAQEFV